MAVVWKPSDRPTVAASLKRDLVRFSEWCSRWCMLLNQSKTKTWAIHGAMVVSSVRILINHRLRTLGVKFDCKLTIGSHVHGFVSRVSQRIGVLKMVSVVIADTSVLHHYYEFMQQWLYHYGIPAKSLLTPSYTHVQILHTLLNNTREHVRLHE